MLTVTKALSIIVKYCNTVKMKRMNFQKFNLSKHANANICFIWCKGSFRKVNFTSFHKLPSSQKSHKTHNLNNLKKMVTWPLLFLFTFWDCLFRSDDGLWLWFNINVMINKLCCNYMVFCFYVLKRVCFLNICIVLEKLFFKDT